MRSAHPKHIKKLIFNKNKKIKIFKNTSWPPIQTGFFFLEKLKANNTSSMEEDNAQQKDFDFFFTNQ